MVCISPNSRYSRPVDVGLGCDVDRSVVISVGNVAARLASKLSLRLAVGLFAIPTHRTGTRGVARVNRFQSHTCELGFVRKEVAKLEKAPARQIIPSRFSNPYPFGDTSQVLDSNTQAVVFSGLNDGLTDNVVCVGSEAGFFTTQFFEFALSRPGAALLQTLAKAAVLAAYSLDLSATVGLALGVGSQLSDAKVNAEKPLDIFGRRFRDVAGSEQIERTVNQHEVTLALLGFKQFPLTLTRAKENGLTPRRRPNVDLVPVQFPSQDASVERNRPQQLKAPHGFSVQLVSVRHFGDAAHNHLRRELKPLPCVVIAEPMEVELLEGLVIPRELTQVVARRIRGFKGVFKALKLLRRRQQLDFSGQPHPLSISHLSIMEAAQGVHAALRQAPFPPMTKVTGVQGAYPA